MRHIRSCWGLTLPLLREAGIGFVRGEAVGIRSEVRMVSGEPVLQMRPRLYEAHPELLGVDLAAATRSRDWLRPGRGGRDQIGGEDGVRGAGVADASEAV